MESYSFFSHLHTHAIILSLFQKHTPTHADIHTHTRILTDIT